jgi:opacity protein-like surface antigen
MTKGKWLMGSIKAFLIASMLAVAATNLAGAADLLPPPPPIEPVVVPTANFSGWYLRGDVGVGIASLSNLRSSFDSGFSVVGDQFNSQSIGDSTSLGLGVGYQVNNWFRADITGEYRTSAQYHAIESAVFSCFGVVSRCFDNYSGQVSSAVVLANGYVDLGTWYGFTPFVGAGIGFSENFFQGLTDQGENSGFGFASNHTSTSLAWAAMFGVSYAITPNLKLELGYRYLDQGTITSGAIQCQNTTGCGHEVQQFHLASNDIRLGMRWIFADLPPPPPVMPLVTKY